MLIAGLLVLSLTVKAQYNYPEWGFGGSYGTNKPYSDLKQNDTQKCFSGSIFYNYSPYMPFALEIGAGKLSGGNNETDASHRYFVNNYISLNVHGDLQLGEIIDYDGDFFMERLKGLYMGLGIGVIFNNLTSIRRYAVDVPDYRFPGNDHGIDALIPIRFGYEFKIFNYNDVPFAAIDIGYTHNLTFAEGLDGYSDPLSKFKNNSQDMFRQITIGIKFNIGNEAAYIKSIP